MANPGEPEQGLSILGPYPFLSASFRMARPSFG